MRQNSGTRRSDGERCDAVCATQGVRETPTRRTNIRNSSEFETVRNLLP